jgi:hypothetical protein
MWYNYLVESTVKLTIKIANKDPINLFDLTVGLQSLGKLYEDFTGRTSEAKLFVKEVRQGSIEIDLISFVTASVLPLLSNVNNIIQFCDYLCMLIKICKKEKVQPEDTKPYLPAPTSKDIKHFEDVLGIAQTNPDNEFSFGAHDMANNTIYSNCQFYGTDAIQMKKNISEISKNENITVMQKMLFQWVQANFDDSKTGNKGKIENITAEPLKVIFDDDATKKQMTTSTDSIEWQNKYYFVDVEIQYSDNKPKAYKILKNYPEDSFPISE